jgi:protein-L-isoaspartate(D-aspartate) O-methyltransferase
MRLMDFAEARQKMLDQQIRPWEVVDQRVLDVIACTPREHYVPEAYRRLAYADMCLPLGQGQVMMPPKLEARLVQALDIEPRDRILEIGTGSGYVTAVLAQLGAHVYSVEIIPEFQARAAEKLAQAGIQNVTLEVGDAARGWSRHAPYDAIFVGGSLPLFPEEMRDQFAPQGRMVVIVGRSPAMEARRIMRLDGHNWSESSLFETDLPPLMNAPEPSRFVF